MDLPDRPLLPHRTSGPTQPVKGLRTKGAGSHANLYDALRAQIHPPLGPILDAFDWMRRLDATTAQQHRKPRLRIFLLPSKGVPPDDFSVMEIQQFERPRCLRRAGA